MQLYSVLRTDCYRQIHSTQTLVQDKFFFVDEKVAEVRRRIRKEQVETQKVKFYVCMIKEFVNVGIKTQNLKMNSNPLNKLQKHTQTR
jgi:hypothetical protein